MKQTPPIVAPRNPAKHAVQAKRVLVFASQLLPWSETFIREQVLAMQQWHPILVGEKRAANGLSLDGINFHLLCPPEEGPGRRWIYTLYRLLRLSHPTSVRRLRALDASLIHAHFGTVAVDIWPLARALGLPMLVTLHGFDINIYREWWESGKGGWRRRSYPKQLLRLAREPKVFFIAVSEAIRKRAIEFGIPEDKVIVCYIGIDIKKFKPSGFPISQRPKRVLFVGRLVEKKGVEYLIRAFAKVQAIVRDAELVIIGNGPLRSELQELSNSLNVDVSFRGTLVSEKISQEMSQSRVLCLPSITAENGDAEGLPMVILEAQSSGLPVITSATGGRDEGIQDGVTGLAYLEGDLDMLSKSICRLLIQKEEAEQLGRAARIHTEHNFDLAILTATLEGIYNERCS